MPPREPTPPVARRATRTQSRRRPIVFIPLFPPPSTVDEIAHRTNLQIGTLAVTPCSWLIYILLSEKITLWHEVGALIFTILLFVGLSLLWKPPSSGSAAALSEEGIGYSVLWHPRSVSAFIFICYLTALFLIMPLLSFLRFLFGIVVFLGFVIRRVGVRLCFDRVGAWIKTRTWFQRGSSVGECAI